MRLEAWKKKGQYVDYRGHPVFYMDHGAGDALLCIHGFPTASWDWAWIWPALTRRFRVVAADMLGFGFSAKPVRYEYTLHDQADLQEYLLAHLDLDRVHILAHDYGDTVAQELLARFIERGEAATPHIRSVCLLNGGIIPGEHRPRLIQRLLISPLGPLVGRFMNESAFHRSFRQIFGPDTQPTSEELAQFWQLIAHNNGRRIVHKLVRYMRERVTFKDRWVGALQQSPVPLRFINGPNDPVSGRHMAEMYRQLVPDPDLVLLEGIGHYPHVEVPDATLQAILAFIDTAMSREPRRGSPS